MAVVPSPVNPTGDLAARLPSNDATPVIDAQEQSLQDYLNLPVQEILARLGLPPFPAAPPPPDADLPEASAGAATPMDPAALIQPVTDALGTLGSGLFESLDPTQMFQGIAQAFQSTGGSLQQSLVPLQQDWQGVSGSAAGSKTSIAIDNGAEVGAQADELQRSLSSAAAEVQQARARLIAIINEFQAKIAAIGPNIIFPWGWAAALEAASEASTQSAEVMTELQGSLGAETAAVMKAGAPVPITAAEQGASSGSAPWMSAVTQAMSAGMGAATKAMQAGLKAGSDLAAATAAPPVPAPFTGAKPPGGGGMPVGGGGGGGSATPASRSIATSPMLQPETTGAAAQSQTGRSAGGAGMAGSPMMGGAPMAGHGARAGNEGNYSSPSFLHTTDQGDAIVGSLGHVAPPVLGGSEAHDSPDVKFRI